MLKANPDIAERIMYEGVMFSLNGNDFGGLFASKKHVSFEFTHSVECDDPKKYWRAWASFADILSGRKARILSKKPLVFCCSTNLKPSGQPAWLNNIRAGLTALSPLRRRVFGREMFQASVLVRDSCGTDLHSHNHEQFPPSSGRWA